MKTEPRHVTVSRHGSYDAAFDAAAAIVHSRRKEAWDGRVRIKYRKSTQMFEVQVPVIPPRANP